MRSILLAGIICLLSVVASAAELPVFDLSPSGPVLNANIDLYGMDADPCDWQGNIEWKTPPFFIDPATGKPDPAWESLTGAFPLHRMRYNVGNRYTWRDNIGPVAQRKKIKHEGWNLYYRPEAGIDEFLRWNESLPQPPKVSLIASPFMPVKESVDLLAYCNATSGPMAKLRAANGHPKPYNVMYWELGNESDFGTRGSINKTDNLTDEQKEAPMLVSDYIAACKPLIKAMRSVDPRIKIYAHTKNPPWYYDNPKWPEWHQQVIKELGTEIDGIAIHPYYDGYTVPDVLRSVDQVVNDIKIMGPKGHKLGVWASEHAKWWNEKDVPGDWNLHSAICTADFLIEVMKRPGVDAATYWCYAHTGPWQVFQKDADQWYGTAIFELYRLLNDTYLPKVQPLTVDQHDYKTNPHAYDYNVKAELFMDPKTERKVLVAANRSADQSFVLRLPLKEHRQLSVERLVITGDSITATNTAKTPDAVTRRETLSVVTPDADGAVKLTMPARSITAWIMTPAK